VERQQKHENLKAVRIAEMADTVVGIVGVAVLRLGLFAAVCGDWVKLSEAVLAR
jgi:hypothetical protein